MIKIQIQKNDIIVRFYLNNKMSLFYLIIFIFISRNNWLNESNTFLNWPRCHRLL